MKTIILPMTSHLQSLLLTLSCISQALTQAYLQVQYPELDVPKHTAEHSCPYYCNYFYNWYFSFNGLGIFSSVHLI